MEIINETIEVQVKQKVYQIRIKEMEKNIVKWEEENTVCRKVGVEEELSSEEGDNFDVSEIESTEEYSDEESQAESIETICRESSPEIDFNYDKREVLINKINENFWGAENFPTEDHHVEKGGINYSVVHKEIHQPIVNDFSTSPLRIQIGDGSRPNHVGEFSSNQANEDGGNFIKSYDLDLPVSDKINKSQGSKNVLEKDEYGSGKITDKMKILLSRSTPLENKLKMIDEEEKQKRILDPEGSKAKE
ncbi:hypothetical protein L2E82_09892 [Cichorium intybus]|uniref:Uncharacterized protein n=1 Tax=Cichorium intybus TaxID=13427 RepID=A0ACB9G9B4_CICIN|nr:hypothetical protein L2E82_09892 [Cichorium intybus]